jgi:hypothetical protein
MRFPYLKPTAFMQALFCKVHIYFIEKSEDYKKFPRQRRLMLASATVTMTGLLILNAAHAEGGLAGMVDTAAQQGESIKTSAGKLFSAMGFGGAGYGGYNWWRKGKEGDQSHIKGSQIFVPILAGAVLGATGFVMIKAGETVGIQSSYQGQTPT